MKIPKEAKCVFKGIIFDVYQWEQRQHDGSFATFEAIKRPNTIQVIAAAGTDVLIGLEEQPTHKKQLSFFGGRQEDGETPLECAKRELLEETGLVSDDWILWKSYHPIMKMEWDIHVFIARDCRKEKEPELEPGEAIDVIRLCFDDFIERVSVESFWSTEISSDIFRMKSEGRLGELREKIFP